MSNDSGAKICNQLYQALERGATQGAKGKDSLVNPTYGMYVAL